MNIHITEHIQKIIIVTVFGRIDAMTAPQLRDRVTDLGASGNSQFIIDLSTSEFIDSAGMAVLITLLKRIRQANGEIKLVWPRNEMPRRVLKLIRFDQVFDMAETTDDALQLYVA